MNIIRIPSWKKSEMFLSLHTDTVFIETGADETGNILSIENFDHCVNKYGNTMNMITGDGGFDFSVSFNTQELMTIPLMYAQICYAISMQKKGGNFILKIFDSFHSATVDMLFLLSSFYRDVYICKPQTSRMGNSEKYVVCKNFIHDNTDEINVVLRKSLNEVIECYNEGKHVIRLLNLPIPAYFITKLEEYNAIFGQHQIENIHQTLSLVDKHVKMDRIDQMIKQNISKCIQWCIKHHVPYNTMNSNIFSGGNGTNYNQNQQSVTNTTVSPTLDPEEIMVASV